MHGRERVPQAKVQCELRCSRGRSCHPAPVQGYAWAQPPAPSPQPELGRGCGHTALPVPVQTLCPPCRGPFQRTAVPTSTLGRTLTSFLCLLSLPTASLTQHRSRDSISIRGLDPRKAQISLLFKETPKRSSPDLKDNSGALSALSGLGKLGQGTGLGVQKGARE